MLEVEPIGQRGPLTTGSGHIGVHLEKNYVVSISKTKRDRAMITVKHDRLPIIAIIIGSI